MTSRLSPYIGFRDTAGPAMEFYRSVFGGELTSSTFADMHASEDPAEANKIMHSQLVTASGFTLMASDTPDSMERPDVSNISVSLSGDSESEAELSGYYAKLAEGGQQVVPLAKAPWGDASGMVVDRFGVGWMVNITA